MLAISSYSADTAATLLIPLQHEIEVLKAELAAERAARQVAGGHSIDSPENSVAQLGAGRAAFEACFEKSPKSESASAIARV